MRHSILILTLVVSAALVGASPKDPESPNITVRIRDLQYQPANVNLKIGQSVTWINADDRDHTVTAVDNSFDSGNLKPGASYTFRFNKAGSFQYVCTYHPRMRGSVQVSN
jgi:plastocyanin